MHARARQTPRNRAIEPQGRAWLESAGGDRQRLMLYGIVGDDWDGFISDEVVQMLAGLQQDVLDVHINSPGGFVWEGIAIKNHLTAHRADITVIIDGLAASMGSFIAMAGDTVKMHASAMMMIHNPWTVSAGEADDLRKDADMLDKVRDALVGAYMDKSGMSRNEILDIMNAETWLTAEEAVEMGFADEVIDDGQSAQDRIAALDLSLIDMEHAPQSIRRLAHPKAGRQSPRPSAKRGKQAATNKGGDSDMNHSVLVKIASALAAAFQAMAPDEATGKELLGQMAEISGMKEDQVQAVLDGKSTDFTMDQLNNFAFVLDTDVSTLMGGEPQPKSKGSQKNKTPPDDPIEAFAQCATASRLVPTVSAAAFREDPEAVMNDLVTAATEKGAGAREREVMDRAKEIKAMCRQANKPEMAMELFLEGLSPAESRERLFDKLASQQRVDNNLSADGALGGPGQPAIDTFAIYEKRRKVS